MRMRADPPAVGIDMLSPLDDSFSLPAEMTACRHPQAGEMDAYERVLGDALLGAATLFAREDHVEEAWRIVEPALQPGTPIHSYPPGHWGPAEAQAVAPPGGWHAPRP